MRPPSASDIEVVSKWRPCRALATRKTCSKLRCSHHMAGADGCSDLCSGGKLPRFAALHLWCVYRRNCTVRGKACHSLHSQLPNSAAKQVSAVGESLSAKMPLRYTSSHFTLRSRRFKSSFLFSIKACLKEPLARSITSASRVFAGGQAAAHSVKSQSALFIDTPTARAEVRTQAIVWWTFDLRLHRNFKVLRNGNEEWIGGAGRPRTSDPPFVS